MTHVIADISRYDPSVDREPRLQRYEIPLERRMTVMALLRYLYENVDPTLAFRNYECGRGICNSCRIDLNGRQVKACSVRVRAGDHLVIRPHAQARVIRDLVCEGE